ncbi:MAG TPA: hypothetical protein VE954_19145 [Oligoflexus sp.]|uniref:hypothetical protein n=1 Tax=Oligoflexus sp. TaxID=1971216 RepID=UPI002D6FA3F2|nr:hypothetical protein [Oligoflexus sp.]HYX35217.1 hypothetical protein [Oligoflexus sp.]
MDYTQSIRFEAICAADPIEGLALIPDEYNNIIVVGPDFEMGDINGLHFQARLQFNSKYLSNCAYHQWWFRDFGLVWAHGLPTYL